MASSTSNLVPFHLKQEKNFRNPHKDFYTFAVDVTCRADTLNHEGWRLTVPAFTGRAKLKPAGPSTSDGSGRLKRLMPGWRQAPKTSACTSALTNPTPGS
ncbi:hypothetical protein EGR_05460 [Echinococcus granulosus]|uniref:Uncharacterized protein n=1 Tax=Echinococcus granulosus TaxID=6210 RepID=W6UF11_ECHGR|nr:hypothetical protein EGR_05460 [Echinococcus granulosus]EUB59698.1 hypothetical protein EGR_05460 [Echinococcus granulosus]